MKFSEAYNILFSDPSEFFLCLPDGRVLGKQHTIEYFHAITEGKKTLSVYPGSWNPIHKGHRWIFDNMLLNCSEIKMFEISLARWGKPFLSEEEVSSRVSQFRDYAPILVTAAPRFVEKAGILSEFTVRWHVGYDTITRMRDDYGEIGISGLRGSFVVYDRLISEEKGVEGYPMGFTHLPSNVSRATFQPPPSHQGFSSTKIRATNGY